MAKTTLVISTFILLFVGFLFLIPAAVSDWTAEGPTWANTSYDDTRIQRATNNIIIDWNPGNETSRWTFDENTGTDIHDENATNTNDGVLIGNWTTADWVDLTYPGDIINVTADSTLEGFSELTLIAKINRTTNPGDNWGRIISKAQIDNDDYAMSMVGILSPSDTGKIGFRINTDEGVTTIKSSTVCANFSEYFVACRWRDSDGYMDIVIDGAIDGTPGSQSGTIDDSNLNLGIGNHPYDNTNSRTFNGHIEYTIVTDRFLSLTELWAIDNNTHHNKGNITIFHDEGTGYVLDEISVCADTGDGSDTNYTVWSRENNTGDYTQLSQNPLVGNSITSPNPVVQNNDIQVRMIGNSSNTMEVSSVTLTAIPSQPDNPDNPSNTTGDYWVNSTWNESSDADLWQVMVYEI